MTKPIIVHVDPKLHEAYRTWAVREDRSLSAQVRHVLRSNLPDDLKADEEEIP